MKFDLVRIVSRNRFALSFSGEITADDLGTGFPCTDPHSALLDALYKDLLASCNHAEPATPETNEQLAFRAEVVGRAFRAIAVADDAVTVDGEVVGPRPQPVDGLPAVEGLTA